MQKHYSPEALKKDFHCPYCNVYSAQLWVKLFYYSQGGYTVDNEIDVCVCQHCNKWSYWHQKRMIVPSEAPVPQAHPDLPQACKGDYDEARSIAATSPRASAALLRLLLQKLMPILGEKGKNINDDIASLVSKGLPIELQQALDYCRVVGNNAVHPGEIDLNDTPGAAFSLFEMINFIVEDRISRPNKIKALYGTLPEAAKQAIEKRDS